VFENLLFQERASDQLVSMIAARAIPPALLFAGPEGAGKFTAALEFARVCSCERDGQWNCSCPQCARHRSLSHPDLLVFGPRSSPQEIAVTSEYFSGSPSVSSYYAFVRAVRKLLRRFDTTLWAGEESKLSKAASAIESLEEMLEEISTLVAKKKNDPLKSVTQKAVEVTAGLEAMVPDGIPVFMVRNMAAWASLAPASAQKTIIIQNADAANESARNAMLKILEEPPARARFVLTSSRRAALIATILSRSRLISFNARSEEQSREIVSRLFKMRDDAASLQEFFQKRSAYPTEKASADAELFFGALLAEAMARDSALSGDAAEELARRAATSRVSAARALKTIAEETGSFGAKSAKFADSLYVFIRASTRLLASVALDPTSSPSLVAHIDRVSAKLRELGVQYKALNRSPELLLEAFANVLGVRNESSL